MDNIVFEKLWQENGLLELGIKASSELISAYQSCYVQNSDLANISKKMIEYTDNYKSGCYLEFGNKKENYTPAFSMLIMPSDKYGHIKIEVDMEIDDNNTKNHRCCFYVDSELGSIESLGISLKRLLYNEKDTMAILNN